jgi:ketosteroid isomerase-like protein
MIYLIATLAALLSPVQDRNAALQQTLDDWVAMWNSYDLDEVERLFVADETVTYFSSERDGLIQGFDELLAHHEGFGFRSGGAETESRLWLEDVIGRWDGSTAVVMATWLFGQAESEGPPQAGPVTFVVVPRDGTYRILHAHFANAAGG